jgi:L-lactate dehydrogenase complex protein LldG
MTETALTPIEQFTARLTAVGGQVATAFDLTAAGEQVAALARAKETTTVWISAEVRQRCSNLVAALNRLDIATLVPTDAAEVRDQPLGLTIAEATIAETGSSILAEPRTESRSVTLITECLVVICPQANLLPSLTEAAPVLRQISSRGASYATFVTGPSRTADIERQLTVGVQGPSEFHVILIDRLT